MAAGVMSVRSYVGERAMTMGVLTLRRLAVLLFTSVCLTLGFGAAPAAAGGCGYGCYAPTPVIVQPSCSCCGCGASYGYYGGYAGYGYGYAGYAGYGYGAYGAHAGYDGYYGAYRRGCGARWC